MPGSVSPILILCENEHTAQLDRRALRDCGFSNVRLMTSGIDAARALANMSAREQQISLVLCHERLADMRSDQFNAIIRTHPLLKNFPVLFIYNNSPDASQDFKKDKASAALIRPYSLSELGNKVNALINSYKERNSADMPDKIDCADFNKALASYGLLLCEERSTDDYFHMGMDYLKEQNWNLAISAFRKSVHDHRLKAEAELGMAAAYKGNNDVLNFRQSLANAAESFVRSGRWNRGRSAYARLLQHDKTAKNPFLAEAHRYIKLGEYKKASEIIQESLPLIPKGYAGTKLAQLCFLADEPETMLNALFDILDDQVSSILKSEVSQHLHILARQKEERERQKSAERKWELSRKARTRHEESKPVPYPAGAKPELREENAIAFLETEGDNDNYGSESEEGDLRENDNASEEDKKPGEILAPLTRPEATSDLFVKKPKFNEFLSVVKLTWKLARRSKRKNNE